MPNYIVNKSELWTQRVSIDARSPEEARQKVARGWGHILEDAKYQHNYQSDTWEVEEDSCPEVSKET